MGVLADAANAMAGSVQSPQDQAAAVQNQQNQQLQAIASTGDTGAVMDYLKNHDPKSYAAIQEAQGNYQQSLAQAANQSSQIPGNIAKGDQEVTKNAQMSAEFNANVYQGLGQLKQQQTQSGASPDQAQQAVNQAYQQLLPVIKQHDPLAPDQYDPNRALVAIHQGIGAQNEYQTQTAIQGKQIDMQNTMIQKQYQSQLDQQKDATASELKQAEATHQAQLDVAKSNATPTDMQKQLDFADQKEAAGDTQAAQQIRQKVLYPDMKFEDFQRAQGIQDATSQVNAAKSILFNTTQDAQGNTIATPKSAQDYLGLGLNTRRQAQGAVVAAIKGVNPSMTDKDAEATAQQYLPSLGDSDSTVKTKFMQLQSMVTNAQQAVGHQMGTPVSAAPSPLETAAPAPAPLDPATEAHINELATQYANKGVPADVIAKTISQYRAAKAQQQPQAAPQQAPNPGQAPPPQMQPPAAPVPQGAVPPPSQGMAPPQGNPQAPPQMGNPQMALPTNPAANAPPAALPVGQAAPGPNAQLAATMNAVANNPMAQPATPPQGIPPSPTSMAKPAPSTPSIAQNTLAVPTNPAALKAPVAPLTAQNTATGMTTDAAPKAVQAVAASTGVQMTPQTTSRVQAATTAATTSDNPTPYQLASAMIGENEVKDKKALGSFFSKSLGQNIDPSQVPWCAALIGSVFEASGIKSPKNPLAARSYLTVGTPTDKPTQGDIVVFSRGSDPSKGHVGLVVGFETKNGIKYVKTLGGNQGDQVSVKDFPASRVLGYRHPPSASDIQQQAQSFGKPQLTPGGQVDRNSFGLHNDFTDSSLLQLKNEYPLTGDSGGLNRDNVTNPYAAAVGQANSTAPSSGTSYNDKVAQIESGGNSQAGASNPGGAVGKYQFEPSTWKGLVSQYGSELGVGVGDRTDPTAQDKMMNKFTQENQQILTNKLGRAPDPAETYMAHNLGAGGAAKLLTADPSALVTKSLIGSNPRQNPMFLMQGSKPLTVGEAIARYKKQFQGVKFNA